MSTFSKSLSSLVALIVLAGVASIATAAPPSIDARLSVVLIQTKGSVETSVAANAAKPGDVLEYSARYDNRGPAAVGALAPTMPIPTGTEYLPGQALPRPTHASLDGTTYAPIPLQRPVKGDDGVTRLVDVPPREYRALRWSVGTLAAGADVTVRARVRVGPPATVASR